MEVENENEDFRVKKIFQEGERVKRWKFDTVLWAT
jgi:hypothetical protein